MYKSFCKVLLVVTILAIPFSLFAQNGSVVGKVTEAGTNEVLPGANLMLKGTNLGAASGLNGAYQISSIPPGAYTLVASFMGYKSIEQEVKIEANKKTTVNIVLESEVLIGKEVSILADRAKERQTPVAFSNVQKSDMEARLGSRDIPLVLNVTPSVYATAQGGGAGDSRINVRGFNQQNIAIMINGVPINDMENGWVYWSNWDGLGDATSSIQMQRGLSSVNLATPSIGGTMNVITDPAAQSPGVLYKQEFGNDGFLKTTLSAATGQINGKYAVMATVVRKVGDGLIDKTWTDAWAYYLGASYQVNKTNRLELYVAGAPQRHGQNRYMQNIAAYDSTFAKSLDDFDTAAIKKFPESKAGRLYNQNWGPLNNVYESYGQQAVGDRRFSRYSTHFINEIENFYHKPLVNLNWYSQLSSKWNLFSTLYWSGGIGGGTGYLGSIKWDYSGPSRTPDWDATIEANKYSTDGSKGILRNSRNDQWTVGLISKANFKPSKAFDVNFGVDWRTAEIEHYREVSDLLGGSYYRAPSYYGSDFWTEDEYVLGLGDEVDYNNTNTVDWIGFFGQGEYSMGPVTAYAMAGYSTIKYSFVDHFTDDGKDNELKLESDNIGGYQVKGGAQYNITKNLDVYGNVGLVSKVPIFDSVIDDVNKNKTENAENEKFTSFEMGLNWFSNKLTAKVSYYYTQWTDRAVTRGVTMEDGRYVIIFLTGMDQLHSGIEFEGAYQPVDFVRLDLAGSLGNWKYTDDVSGQYKDYDNPDNSSIPYDYYIKDLKVGDAPQTQIALAASLFPVKGLWLQGVYKYYASHYAQFDPESRTDENDREESWMAPNYGLLDFHASYRLPVKLGPVGIKVFAHVFNALDEIYIQDAIDNSSYNAYRDDDKNIVNPHKADAAEVFLGIPRMFNVGLQLEL